MADRISVRLAGPAKIEGTWRKPGEDVPVTPELAVELAASGVIAEGDAQGMADLAPGMPGFDEAVAAMAKVLADAAVHAAVEVATVELTRDRDEYRALAQGAESQVNRLEARVFELEAELAEAQGVPAKAEAEKPAESDAAPQAALKKGSGAKKG